MAEPKFKDGKILRFSGVARFAHWAHTVTFFLLAITGMIIYLDAFDFLAPLFGGIQGARITHRVMAIGFVGAPLISVLMRPKGFLHWMKVCFSWGPNELGFFKAFLVEFTGGHPEMPPQQQFNAGEKINSLLQVFGCSFLALSGFIIWFPQAFPQGMVRWGYPIHDLAFILTFTAIIGHMYLSLVHPLTRSAMKGMMYGYIDEGFAAQHYKRWLEEEKAKHQQKQQA